MRLSVILPVLMLLSASFAANADENPATTPSPPQWYLDDIEFLTRDGGRWLASNANYQNENETAEAYALEWEKGYANSMTGRLYGIIDGEPTGDFWRFRQYWHPGKGKAVLEQFGLGGAIGIGTIWLDDGASKSKQIFYAPDGSATPQGHITRNQEDGDHFTESFNIVDDEWTPSRAYTWKRAPEVEDK